MRIKTFAYSSVSAALLSAGVLAPAAFADGDTVALQLYGQRNWEISCEMNQTDGDRIASRERGRGSQSTGRIVARDVAAGSCDYTVADNGMLRVTLVLERTNLECPFEMTEDGFCRAYFSGGSTGSFQINSLSASNGETGS